MIVLGFDPGTATTGYGVATIEAGRPKEISHGVILTASKWTLAERVRHIHEEALKIITEFTPESIVLESLFFNCNVKTAINVGQARGVLLLAAAKHSIPVWEYTPQQVKLAVVGNGAATKKQVQYMVKTLTCMKVTPKPDDAADALAVAICHLNSSAMIRAVGKA